MHVRKYLFNSEHKLSINLIFISHLVMLIAFMRLNIFVYIANALEGMLNIYNFIIYLVDY
ncbi:hypothetical protein C9J48_22260 [Photobacterium profundum]|uniref:Uncharacterized protein n=1 Tax=Photobacterium profundum 3TCK TaxID=314280 RepID=Q1YZF0_9GAMM|nr:hypothetical protein P3TCK_19425 [Photobacterium profundum 3TCK]PSV59714.1 hypothetical protein C9J48_22260 [Photobacterium profundum]